MPPSAAGSGDGSSAEATGVIGVAPSKVKMVKTALESRSWIDKNLKIFDCSSADEAATSAAQVHTQSHHNGIFKWDL